MFEGLRIPGVFSGLWPEACLATEGLRRLRPYTLNFTLSLQVPTF